MDAQLHMPATVYKKTKHFPRNGAVKQEKCKKMFTIGLKFTSLLCSSRIFAILKCSPRYCIFYTFNDFMKKIVLIPHCGVATNFWMDILLSAHTCRATFRAVVFDFQLFV
jgi:hypothetical protein